MADEEVETDRWGRRKVQQSAEAPAPVRVEAPAAGDKPGGALMDFIMNDPRCQQGKKYNNDYSRFFSPFSMEGGEEDDEEEEEEGVHPAMSAEVEAGRAMIIPPGHAPPQLQTVQLPDGTVVAQVPEGGLPPGTVLPPGMAEVPAEQVPGHPKLLARAAEHFKAMEGKGLRNEVEKVMKRMQGIVEDRMSDARFRSFLGKYFEAYRIDKETLTNFHCMFANKELKWWIINDPWEKVVPLICPELFEWWYEKNPIHNFEKIADYFVAVSSYPKFLVQCQKQIEDRQGKLPLPDCVLKQEVLASYGVGLEHQRLLRAWSLSKMMEVWLMQWHAGMQGNRQGVGFAAGVEQFAHHSRTQLQKPRGWCDPPPGSTTNMLRTIVPSRNTVKPCMTPGAI